MVRLKGLEPSRPKTPDPKSGASTNSATSAIVVKIVRTGKPKVSSDARGTAYLLQR